MSRGMFIYIFYILIISFILITLFILLRNKIKKMNILNQKKDETIVNQAMNQDKVKLTEYSDNYENIKDNNIKNLKDNIIHVFEKEKEISPKTLGQKKFIDAVQKNEIVFVVGPAGTGKTYLSVALALSALKSKRVNKIILIRPAVEAGESLGYLPVDLLEKIDPYYRPLYDAIYEMMPAEKLQKYMERGIIEIAPLSYMRGRTLSDSFIILDDAQNTTFGQMKMFLTRFGFGSKIIINGDITQIDLPRKENSGLIKISKVLEKIKGTKFIYLNDQDVVRHKFVQEVIRAYEKEDLGKQ